MKLQHLAILAVALISAAGCTESTAESKQPTAAEIEQGKQRRLQEIDKMQIPEAAKARMRAQVNGGNPSGSAPERK